MRKVQIDIKKQKEKYQITLSVGGGVVSNRGLGVTPPIEGVKISLLKYVAIIYHVGYTLNM